MEQISPSVVELQHRQKNWVPDRSSQKGLTGLWQCHCKSMSQEGSVRLHMTWISQALLQLTHWGWVTHICVGKLTIIGSDNGLSPGRRQAIIWTNVGILLIRPLGTNFNEILIEIHTFSFKKMHLKMLSAKWQPFCLVLNVLKHPQSHDGWMDGDYCIIPLLPIRKAGNDNTNHFQTMFHTMLTVLPSRSRNVKQSSCLPKTSPGH